MKWRYFNVSLLRNKSILQNYCVLLTPFRGVRGQTSNVSRSQYKAKADVSAEHFSVPLVSDIDFTPSSTRTASLHANKNKIQPEVSSDLQTNILYKPILQDNFIKKSSLVSKPYEDVNVNNQFERLCKQVTPLWKFPYNTQLKIKFQRNMNILKELGRKLKSAKTKIFIDDQNIPCPLELVKPSPVINAYRNKDEFSIRSGVDGNMKTVGFYLGSTAENPNVFCVGPDHLVNIKDSHKKLAKAFQTYIRRSSLPPCIHFNDGGYWRNIIIRSNLNDEIMAVIKMHPQNLTKEELDSEKQELKSFFSEGEGKIPKLKSLYFQACPHSKCSHKIAPFELLMGDPYLLEELNGLKFQISPETFFQVNTKAAEILYDTVNRLCCPTPSTTLLDICCGIGSISLSLAPYVRSTIGIEASEDSVHDAKLNAELNKIKNATFICGRAEKILPDLLLEMYSDDLVAVLNPSRQGFNSPMMKTLRECKHLKRIVYISCKPEGQPLKNFIELCRPPVDVKFGQPFVPIKAIPIDLFPHTDHSELIILFERL